MLSNALSSGKTPESILNGDAVQMASQLKISIRTHCRVVAIDQPGCAVTLVDGEKIFYDQLVLALGADQVHLPLLGDGIEKSNAVVPMFGIFRTSSSKDCCCSKLTTFW